ncbi:MAG: hypothetical protein A2521_02055 [Deltaproteobacteria bacterium RIFOXYD12_FULL_57_12]|nr:MAG: hypothetical protein A2521_02055 [Deltaproteobacteria bacterium RIFOXYD12_FULL_57_12]
MAEAKWLAGDTTIGKITGSAVRDLVHELRTRQLELEMQNEELRRAQDELVEARDRHRALFDFAPIGYFTLDRKGNIQAVNVFGAAMLATERDALRKSSFPLFIDQEDRAAFFKHLRLVFQTGNRQSCVIRLIKGNGDRLHAQLKSAILPSWACEPNHCCIAVIDVTESEKVAMALKNSSEKIKMFAWSISHDLKNPALVVHGLTKRLRERYRDILDNNGGTYCKQLLKASGEIVDLVDKINEYILTGEVPLKIETVRLRDLFQNIREEFAGRFDQRRTRLAVLGDPPEIRADRLAILRALRNLVDNALKYGGKEMSAIEIGYGENRRHHILCVQDDGVGIALQDTRKIFKQFIRLESAKNVSGSGLGLSIVKDIAEQHQGQVWTEPAPRQGTIFCMSISKQL